MKISVFCDVCNKTSFVEYEPDQTTTSQDSGVIPIPNLKKNSSGLVQLSVAHSDHILLLEVDRNGDVRKSSTVSRVGHETVMAQFLAMLISIVKQKSLKDQLNCVMVSNNPIWDEIFTYWGFQSLVEHIRTPDTNHPRDNSVIMKHDYLEIQSHQFSTKKINYASNQTITNNVHLLIFDIEDASHVDEASALVTQNRKRLHKNCVIVIAMDSSKELGVTQKIGELIQHLQTDMKYQVKISDTSSMENRLLLLIQSFDFFED